VTRARAPHRSTYLAAGQILRRRAARGPLTPGPSPANCAGEGSTHRMPWHPFPSARPALRAHPSPEVGGGVGRPREERAKRRPGERAPAARTIADAIIVFDRHATTRVGPSRSTRLAAKRALRRRAARGPLTPGPSPANCAGEGSTHRMPRHPCPSARGTPRAPLPRSWGRGRPQSRGTSEKAAGGEGPRGARLCRSFNPTHSAPLSPHSRTHALTHSRTHTLTYSRTSRPTACFRCGSRSPCWAPG
jgi:hypothetical protein